MPPYNATEDPETDAGGRLRRIEPGEYFARIESWRPEGDVLTLDMVSASGWHPFERGPRTLAGRARAFWQRWQRNAETPEENPLEEFSTQLIDVRHGNDPRWEGWFQDAVWVRVVLDEGVSAADGAISADSLVVDATTSRESRALDRLFSMNLWPSATAQRVQDEIGKIRRVNLLVVQDVGQGSANLLADSGGTALMYVDVGAGMSRPVDLEYCACSSPLIVLTHWHEDHWKGVDFTPDLLEMVWIAPRQIISGYQAQLAARILVAGGTLLIVKRSSRPRTRSTVARQRITVDYCSGRLTSRNNSGLAVQVRNKSAGATWLFPGDADYSVLPPIIDPVSALVAAHHGAKITPPPPVRGLALEYARLVYSFGAGNSYGHPTRQSTDAHLGVGWQHRTVPRSLNSFETRTTAGDTTTNRASIAIGWTGPPSSPNHPSTQHGMTFRT